MIWVIGMAVLGSISLWAVGMKYGGIGINIASIGGICALFVGGAILGAGVGYILYPIVKWLSLAGTGGPTIVTK